MNISCTSDLCKASVCTVVLLTTKCHCSFASGGRLPPRCDRIAFPYVRNTSQCPGGLKASISNRMLDLRLVSNLHLLCGRLLIRKSNRPSRWSDLCSRRGSRPRRTGARLGIGIEQISVLRDPLPSHQGGRSSALGDYSTANTVHGTARGCLPRIGCWWILFRVATRSSSPVDECADSIAEVEGWCGLVGVSRGIQASGQRSRKVKA